MHPATPALALVLAAIGTTLTACAGGPAWGPLGRQLTEDGLARVATRSGGVLYVKPNHPVGSYDDLLIASVGIHYASANHELDEKEEEVILDRMIATIYDEVAAGFELAAEPGPCTAKMGVYLKDVEFYGSGSSSAQTRFVRSFGAATLVFEFRDSVTDAALVRYGLRRSFGAGVDAGSVRGMDVERLGATLDAMLQKAGGTLQEALAPEVADPAGRGCNGNIGKALAGS